MRATVLAAVAASLVAAGAAKAETLPEVLPDLLKISKRVKAAEADMKAANEKAREALGDWFPKLDLTGNYGYERQFKGNNTADTSIPPREFEVKITQLLWDFGSTNRAIDNARLSYEQARSTRDAIEQVVLLEGVTAYLDLLRRTRILEFSRGSEDNIKRQTELEDARVQRGSGFSTDVLQSKRQLASAQAARARAEGALQTARNRYLNVFDKLPERPATMAIPRLPLDRLPATLNEVVDIAARDNPQLKAAKLTTEIARNNVSKTFSDKFAPTINLVGEHGHKNDFDGTIGNKNERMIKVEGKYSFNLGLTAINTLKASEFNLISSENKYGDALDNVQEQARNAWQELETSRQNLEHLRNEANIAAEFLELARKERALGRRSLIDVLAGETALINASSDAASAETDMAIAVFKLLSAMGRLGIEAVVSPSAPPAAAPPAAAPPAQPAPPPAVPVTPVTPTQRGERAPELEAPQEAAKETAKPSPQPSPALAGEGGTRASGGVREPPPAPEVPARVAEAPAKPKMPKTKEAKAPDTKVPDTKVPDTKVQDTKVAAAASAADASPVVEGGPGPTLYLVEKSALRAGTSFLAPAVRPLDKCAPVQFVRSRDDWVFVRSLAAEGWVYGYLVTKDPTACAQQRAAAN